MLAPSAARAQGVAFRGYADVGATTFTAKRSFEAVLGSATGVLYGGGIDVVLPKHIFVDVGASRFQKNGSRVFVNNGQVFNLGIPTTIKVTPIELTGGYRFALSTSSFVPYVGAGIGWRQYEETSQFATASENSSRTFRGYAVIGGLEYRVIDWLGVSGEVTFARVPNALGQDPNGVSAAFGETDLGGTSVVVKFVVGR